MDELVCFECQTFFHVFTRGICELLWVKDWCPVLRNAWVCWVFPIEQVDTVLCIFRTEHQLFVIEVVFSAKSSSSGVRSNLDTLHGIGSVNQGINTGTNPFSPATAPSINQEGPSHTIGGAFHKDCGALGVRDCLYQTIPDVLCCRLVPERDRCVNVSEGFTSPYAIALRVATTNYCPEHRTTVLCETSILCGLSISGQFS